MRNNTDKQFIFIRSIITKFYTQNKTQFINIDYNYFISNNSDVDNFGKHADFK